MTSPALAALEAQLRLALAPTYQLIRQLGQGGMGTVFLARDPALKRHVAVKVLLPSLSDDPEAHARFEREAQAVAALSHPHVVSIYGVGEMQDRTPYFVMQYVEGRSLAAQIEEDGPVSVAEAREMLGEVASALAAAHAKGIIHRDIKPANVLHDEASGRVLVSDFGLAAVGTVAAAEHGGEPDPDSFASGDLRLTQSGMRVGTPQYMSPEQLVAEEVTERTDIYAVGLLAYELLLGHGPFPGKTSAELVAAHLRDTPVSLASLRDDVDPELDALVRQCLAKDSTARPTAADIAARLAPRGVDLLEWPPPGLEAYQGVAGGHARRLSWASGALAASFATFVLLGDRMADVSNSGVGVLILGVMLAGAAGAMWGARTLLRDAWRASRAVRGGYTWSTLLEVAADVRGDTGMLIAGAQQYASLDARARSAMRSRRVSAVSTAVLAAMCTVPLVLLATWLGVRGVLADRAVAVIGVAPLLLAGLWRWRVAVGEWRVTGFARSRRAVRAATSLEGVATPWYAAFDVVRGADARGRGASGRAALGTLISGLALLAVVIGSLVIAPVLLIPLRGPWLAQMTLSQGVATTTWQQLAREAPTFARAPQVSAEITPQAAGEAHHQLSTMLQEARGISGLPERDAAPFVALEPMVPVPDVEQLFARARRGFSADERAALARLSAHPAWQAYARIARAPAMDLLGGRLVLPLPADADYYAMPLAPMQALQELSNANVWRAGWHLSEGRADSAEAVLREAIGVARAMATGTSVVDLTSALRLVTEARGPLLAFYESTGRAEARVWRREMDSVALALTGAQSANQNASQSRSGIAGQRRDRLAALRRRDLPPAVKLDVLAGLSALQCSSLGEALFGSSPELERGAEYVRDSVARYPVERELAMLTLRAPEGFAEAKWSNAPRLGQLPGRMLDFTGRLLGSDRLRGCARWLGDRGAAR